MSTLNGQRQRALEVIAEKASDSIDTGRSPGSTSPGGCAGNNGDSEKPARTPDATAPSLGAQPPELTDSRSSEMLASAGGSVNGSGEGGERAVLLATKVH